MRKGLIVWLVRHWGLLLVMLLAVPMIAYNLNYEPYWQDELTSYYAAKNVLAHGFPLLYSGFPYPKGELYSYLLALSMLLFGEQNGMLRIISVIAYILSLPIFYGVGCYFFERRVALLATAMLAFSPLTLIWGRSVRMYELAQLLAILVMYLFYRALQQRFRPRPIYLAVGVLVTTYLSHEEVFIIFPALVLYVLVASSSGLRRLPWVLTNKHWLIASTVGASIVGAQLLVVHYSHPPILGTDPSQVPFIQFSMENIAYYVKLLFVPQLLSATQPFMAINALLAVVGGIWAIYRGDSRAKYCTLFFVLPFVALVLLFTLRASRYIYPILPTFYLLGAYGLLEGLRFLWGHSHDVITQGGILFGRGLSRRRAPLILTRLTALLLCSSALVAPALPMSGYNLFISQALGLSYHRHYTDYDAAGEYVRTHERPGDIVIAISPAISVLYYVGHVDDFFSVDRALYLFERDGHITDTPTGSTPLLSQGDFRAVLSSHARIWVITDQGLYQSEVDQGRRFVFPPEFRVVYRGYGSAVYLRLS